VTVALLLMNFDVSVGTEVSACRKMVQESSAGISVKAWVSILHNSIFISMNCFQLTLSSLCVDPCSHATTSITQASFLVRGTLIFL